MQVKGHKRWREGHGSLDLAPDSINVLYSHCTLCPYALNGYAGDPRCGRRLAKGMSSPAS